MVDSHADLERDLPPAPEKRFLTPAPEEFERPGRIGAYTWPLFWLGVAVVFYVVASGHGWHPFGGH